MHLPSNKGEKHIIMLLIGYHIQRLRFKSVQRHTTIHIVDTVSFTSTLQGIHFRLDLVELGALITIHVHLLVSILIRRVTFKVRVILI